MDAMDGLLAHVWYWRQNKNEEMCSVRLDLYFIHSPVYWQYWQCGNMRYIECNERI
jgi:hypothetical protein